MRINFVKVYEDRLEQVEEDLKRFAKEKKWSRYYQLKREKEKILVWLEERGKKNNG